MKFLIKNINVVSSKDVKKLDVLIIDRLIEKIDSNIEISPEFNIIDGEGKFLFPGFRPSGSLKLISLPIRRILPLFSHQNCFLRAEDRTRTS